MTKSFDREKDLKYSAIDSKKAFNVINKNNLDNRFASASGGTYM